MKRGERATRPADTDVCAVLARHLEVLRTRRAEVEAEIGRVERALAALEAPLPVSETKPAPALPAAPAPLVPAPSTRASLPLKPSFERRTIKIESISDLEDRFFCKPLGGTLTANLCLQQQEIARAPVTGAGPTVEKLKALKDKYAPTCANCPFGRQVQAQLQ